MEHRAGASEAGLTPSATTRPARAAAVDTAKAAGIVLVVLGHAPGTPVWLVSLVYSFHMPLFFFIAGYLLAPARSLAPLAEVTRRATKSLLVPYVFFFVVSLTYWLLTRRLGARAVRFNGLTLSDAVWGLASGTSQDLFVNVTLWFFPCLFACTLIYAALRRLLGVLGSGALAVGVASVLLAFDLPWQMPLPWGLDIAWLALVFYAAGHALREHAPALLAARKPLDLAAVLPIAALALLWFGLAALEGRVDLANAHFQPRPALYLPTAAAGVFLVLQLSRCCRPTRIAQWLSSNSLIIFPLHPLLINLASGAVKSLHIDVLSSGYGPAWSMLFSAWGIAATVPLARLLSRRFPMLLGRTQLQLN